MAMIDYGAILRVDGKIVNLDQMFMDCADTGYICQQAYDEKHRQTINIQPIGIQHNYFVYAGDENFLLAFYKEWFYVIHQNKIIGFYWHRQFVAESLMFNGLPTVYVEHIDKKLHFPKYLYEPAYDSDDVDRWEYYYGERMAKRIVRKCVAKRRRNLKNKSLMEYGRKLLATWEYNGHKYECIFGYGVDSSQELWFKYDFQKYYDYTEAEFSFIDKWFKENSSVGQG
jgi:hypothetical protein